MLSVHFTATEITSALLKKKCLYDLLSEIRYFEEQLLTKKNRPIWNFPNIFLLTIEEIWLHHCEGHWNQAHDHFSTFTLTTFQKVGSIQTLRKCRTLYKSRTHPVWMHELESGRENFRKMMLPCLQFNQISHNMEIVFPDGCLFIWCRNRFIMVSIYLHTLLRCITYLATKLIGLWVQDSIRLVASIHKYRIHISAENFSKQLPR